MDIENPLGITGCKGFTENRHKACKNNNINTILCQQFFDLFFKGGLAAQFFLQNNLSGNTCVCSSLQSIGLGIIGYHQTDFSAVNHTACLGINERLQVCTAAGYQNGNSRFIHSLPSLTQW